MSLKRTLLNLRPRHFKSLFKHARQTPLYWQGSAMLRRHIARFGDRPQVAIVGAAGGGAFWQPWSVMGLMDMVGFEPDPGAYAELLRQKGSHAHFFPHALGNKTGKQQLYLTKFRECSSCLEPNMEVLRHYPARELFEVEKTTEVQISRFDDLFGKEIKNVPDFLQVDVQGFEMQVLEGFGKHLDSVKAIECESHFKPLYKGEQTFFELKRFLEEKGFVLRHIAPQGPFEGEMVELNVFFSRPPASADPKTASLISFWEWLCDVPLAKYFGSRKQ